jgi:hypothetical protein
MRTHRPARAPAGVFSACLLLSSPAFALEPEIAAPPPPLVLAQAPSSAPAPGTVQVDEATAQRALERSLVRTGALLLERGRGEIEADLAYSRQENEIPVSVGTPPGTVAKDTVYRDVVEPSVLLRVGLPARTQFELGLPYRYAREEHFLESGAGTLASFSDSRTGIGDLRIGLAKGLVTEGPSKPNVVARVTWDTGTGQSDRANVVSLGGYGSDELEFSVNATKRQDPLVFSGGVFYRRAVNGDGRDVYALSLGALLAASPDTSLRVTFDQVHANGAGPYALSSLLTFGASSIIGAGKFLDLSVSAGLTRAAPAYVTRLAFSVPFNAGRFF